MDFSKSDLTRRQFVKIFAAAGAFGASAAALAGCTSASGSASASASGSSSASASSTSASASAAASSASASAATKRTITDDAGRTVEIPSEIKTVAASGFGSRAVVYAGALDRLVGVSESDKRISSALPYAKLNEKLFTELPAVCSGGMNNTVYDEEMVKLAPDVIISTSTDAASDDELQQKLNIPVISVHMNDFDIFEEDFYKSLAMLGEVFGTTAHTDSVIKAMKEWQADLDNRTKDIPDADKPSVYTGGISFRGPHGIEGTYGGYGPFEAVHAKNVVDETGRSGPFSVDLEQITVWNPEFIFLNPDNMGQVKKEVEENADFFKSLQAVKNGNVFAQPSYIAFGTNYELAIADAYDIGKRIYPDKFADVDIEAKADEIFTCVLGAPFMQTLKDEGAGYGKIDLGL